MKYSVVLIPEPEEGGYSVMVPLLPGCFTQGETVEEALANARDAIEVHLRGMAIDGDEIPEEHASLILTQVSVTPEVARA